MFFYWSTTRIKVYKTFFSNYKDTNITLWQFYLVLVTFFKIFFVYLFFFFFFFFILRGSTSGKVTFEMQSPIVGLEKVGKMLIVGCMDKSLTCFTSKVAFFSIDCWLSDFLCLFLIYLSLLYYLFSALNKFQYNKSYNGYMRHFVDKSFLLFIAKRL